jgi:HAE1 family hydrophobic/amphiphilic exporter-1
VTITELSIKRPALITMIFFTLVIWGIYSYLQMGSDLLPKITWPMVLISVEYPGAGPKEVESLVSKPIEEAMASCEGLKSLRTFSNENYSLIWLEFTMSTNADIAMQNVERKLNSIKSKLPNDVKEPIVKKIELNSAPILRITATSNIERNNFFQFVKEHIVPRLEQIPGIASVTIVGGQEREIRVEVDSDKLRLYGIPLSTVVQKLTTENLDIPAGTIEKNEQRYIVRVAGSLKSLQSLENIILASFGNTGVVRIKDVAKVIDSYKENYTISRLNSFECIGLILQKATDANAIKCSNMVQRVINRLEQEYSDKNLKFTIAQDITTFTKKSLFEVKRDMMLAVILVAFVLFVFLHNIRNSIIVLLSIPTSIFTAIAIIHIFGFTINLVTVLALTLIIGILVDDSIVVLENIHRHIEQGENPKVAALTGRNEIGLAAVAITFVDVAVFLPIAMLSGVVGKIFKEFGITVASATLVSLLVSFTLTPMLASRWSRIVYYKENSIIRKVTAYLDSLQKALNKKYLNILKWAINHKKTVVLLSFSLFFLSLSLIPLNLIGREFLPSLDRGEFALNIDMPPGTTIEATNKAILQIEQIICKVPDIQYYYSIVGRKEGAFGTSQRTYIGQIQIKLKESRKHSTNEVISYLLKEANNIPSVSAKASLIGLFGAADQTPIEIEVKGTNLDSLIYSANIVYNIVNTIDGCRDVRSSWEEGQPEIKIELDRDKCALNNIGMSEIAATLRTAFEGEIASVFSDKDSDYDIRVILSKEHRKNIDDILKTTIINRMGQKVFLEDVCRVSISKGASQIARKDKSRVITILANLTGSRSLNDVLRDIDKKIKSNTFPKGINFFYGGDIENMMDMQKDMLKAIFFAVLFVYAIMVCLYESYLYPFIIMFSVPVAVVGGIFLLFVTHSTLNLISIIGILMSIGLVTKNAILIVDYTNTLRARGLSFYDALYTACPIRLRPILMTTSTMVFGMLPLALAIGGAANMRRGLAVCVIGSLLSSMFLTLVLVPVMYAIMENFKNKIIKKT